MKLDYHQTRVKQHMLTEILLHTKKMRSEKKRTDKEINSSKMTSCNDFNIGKEVAKSHT